MSRVSVGVVDFPNVSAGSFIRLSIKRAESEYGMAPNHASPTLWKHLFYFSYENIYFIFRMKTFILLFIWKHLFYFSYENVYFFRPTNSLIVHRDNNFILRLQIANVKHVSFILRIENLLEGVEPEHSAETDVSTFSWEEKDDGFTPELSAALCMMSAKNKNPFLHTKKDYLH